MWLTLEDRSRTRMPADVNICQMSAGCQSTWTNPLDDVIIVVDHGSIDDAPTLSRRRLMPPGRLRAQ
jgi:hypothetical protein